MRTFIIYVTEPKRRSTTLSKLIVVAENETEALRLAKEHYGPEVSGWHPEAKFKMEREIGPNTSLVYG